MFTLTELEEAAELVHRVMPPTPQHAWPLLARRLGSEVWVKHENHTPIGAFKVRGGLVYLDALQRTGRRIPGLVTATRGNHGQSIAFAARRLGMPVTILVPEGNNPEKNAAMEAFGARLVVHGRDFDEAKHEAARLAREEGLEMVPSFDPLLVRGVSTYGLELFRALPDLDIVYVPIGMGSGICGTIMARDLLGLSTEIVGVVAEQAPANALSYEAGHPVPTNSAATFADGVATREPHPLAVATFKNGAARIIRVSENAIAEAVRILFETTHNLAEGAGAAPLAAALIDGARRPGARIGLVLSGGNIDRQTFATILAGRTPAP
jgi:threonine dehydratase